MQARFFNPPLTFPWNLANLGRIDGMQNGDIDALTGDSAGREEPAKLEITHLPAGPMVPSLHCMNCRKTLVLTGPSGKPCARANASLMSIL